MVYSRSQTARNMCEDNASSYYSQLLSQTLQLFSVSVSVTQATRTRYSSASKAAVAMRVLVQVLLMIVFCIIEFRSRFYLGSDWSKSPCCQLFLVEITGSLGQALLLDGVGVDAGPILRSSIVALLHALSWVVALPEQREQVSVGDLCWTVDHPDDLCMAGRSTAHLMVRRVLGVTSRVADLLTVTEITYLLCYTQALAGRRQGQGGGHLQPGKCKG